MTSNLKPYAHEADLSIDNNRSVSFCVPVIPSVPEKVIAHTSNKKVISAIDDPDVYLVHSILVSTVWNKNDDIFDKYETWKARKSPLFKPVNNEHDENQIVGSMIGCWAVDANFNIIPDDTPVDDLPDHYHLMVASVIYRRWSEPENIARVEKLIEEIEANRKYVSMECIFHNFDYGVRDTSNEDYVVLKRNESTSFLTRHLRVYGGEGKYMNKKVGRVLRDIVFIGKGFVDQPANPESIIVFDKDMVKIPEPVVKSSADIFGVSVDDKVSNQLDTENFTMSQDLNTVLKENEALKAELEKIKAARHEETIKALEDKLEELTQERDEAIQAAEHAKSQVEAVTTKCAELNHKLEEAEAKMHDMQEKQKKKERKEKMLKAGIAADEADTKVELFANLNDEQFDAIVALFAATQASDSNDDNDDDDIPAEAESVSDVASDAESGNHATASTVSESELEKARAGFVEWARQNICKTNKGE